MRSATTPGSSPELSPVPDAGTMAGDDAGIVTRRRRSRARRWLDNKWVLRAAGLAFFLGVWEWGLSERRVSPILAAPVSKVVRHVPEVVTDSLYLDSLLDTLELFAISVVIATVIGTVVGIALGRNRALSLALSPWINFLNSMPRVALAPIIVAVVGYTITSNIIIVVVVAVFPVLINAEEGARSVDRNLLEVAASFRSRGPRVWIDVILPACVPFLVVGLRIGFARALLGTVVAETYANPGGLGYLIVKYGFMYDTASMLVVVLTLTFMGLLSYSLIGLLQNWADRWRGTTE